MTSDRNFIHQSEIPGNLTDVWDFHASPGAFQRLAMPPMIIRVHRDERRSLTAGRVTFTLWFGPVPIRWEATHLPGPTEHSFIDRMDKGPLAAWEHTHLMEAVPNGVRLTDKITFRHHHGLRGWLTRLLFDGLALRTLFTYRHWRTRKEVQRIQARNKSDQRTRSRGKLRQ